MSTPERASDLSAAADLAVTSQRSLPPLRPLPSVIRSADEQPWEILAADGEDAWRGREADGLGVTVRIDWGRLGALRIADGRPVFSSRAIAVAKLYVAEQMKKWSAGHSGGVHSAFMKLGSFLASNPNFMPYGRSFEWGDLTVFLFRAFNAQEQRTGSKGKLPGLLRAITKWGTHRKHQTGDFTSSQREKLYAVALKQSRKGRVLEEQDPSVGPFDADEADDLRNAIARPLTDYKADLEYLRGRMLASLLFEVNPRSVELVKARNKHFDVRRVPRDIASVPSSDADLQSYYTLHLPVARKASRGKATDAFGLTNETGAMIEALRDPKAGPDGRLFWWLGVHYSTEINDAMTYFVRAHDLRTPRMQDPESRRGALLPVTTYRFRHTGATERLARGQSPSAVAAHLRHATEELVLITYAAATEDHAGHMTAVQAPVLGPMIDRARRHARGRIDNGENTPASAVEIPAIVPPHLQPARAPLPVAGAQATIGKIGKCAVGLACPKNPVVGCFTCDDYLAAPNGADEIARLHDKFVSKLAEDAEALEPHIVGQLRHTILAMREWVAEIRRVETLARGKLAASPATHRAVRETTEVAP